MCTNILRVYVPTKQFLQGNVQLRHHLVNEEAMFYFLKEICHETDFFKKNFDFNLFQDKELLLPIIDLNFWIILTRKIKRLMMIPMLKFLLTTNHQKILYLRPTARPAKHYRNNYSKLLEDNLCYKMLLLLMRLQIIHQNFNNVQQKEILNL